MLPDESPEPTLEIAARPLPGPWLLEVGSDEGLMSATLELGECKTLGAGGRANLRLTDPAVSQLHCELRAGDSFVELADLGSRNGVFLSGARVGYARLVQLPASFVVGRTTVTIRAAADGQPSEREPSLPGLIGRSEPMRRVAAEVRRHANTRAPVLIQGESGTGKDLVARALHQLGRGSGPYVPLNMGAIAESLADSELFGHRRGAFTGAHAHRQGAFELANRGTLFLDEVAELSAAVQVKLLRVVEDGSVRPLGAERAIRVDTRIVSASWASLRERAAQGRFRADLFHRLSTVTVHLPPLRERRSDIPALAEVLLRRMRDEVGERELSGAALAALVAYEFPGNVRELGSILYRAAVAATGRQISPQDLAITSTARAPRREVDLAPVDAQALLARHAGNISAAARAARMPRTTFRAHLSRSSATASVAEDSPGVHAARPSFPGELQLRMSR